jgi:copper(I)-binding protein
MKLLAAYLFLLLAAWVPAAEAAPPAITVTDAWVRAIPGSGVAAAYFTVRNTGTQPATIVGIRSAVAASAMIHETTMAGTQSTMRPHEQLALAPGQAVHLSPGGMHVMLMDLRQPLNPGDTVALLLLLDGGTSVTVSARVRPLGEQ